MKRIFILLGILFSIQTVFSQNIVKAEYFFDADLGQGKGAAIPNVTPGDIVNLSFDVPTNNLTSGFHFLNTRVADANGVWSRYETRVFYLSSTSTTTTTNITGAEYFFDSDPGVGAGVSVNIGSSGAVVNFPVSPTSPITSGFHTLFIRVRDQEGKWSLFEQKSFYVAPMPVDASPIVAAEYFYDVDPGMGGASPLIVNSAGDIITQTFFIPVPNSLSQGDHVLAIRVKDQEGHWSFLAKNTITVSNTATISCPANVIVTAPAGQCSAVVNGIDPTIAPSGTSYMYTLTGVTTGTGAGTASGKTFNAGVTTVTYALTNSPATSCSFTVSVNTNVVPSVSISASQTTICSGQQVTFTATPINGGNSPVYEWLLNGGPVGTNSNIYQSSTLKNGDIITVGMSSSLGCAIPKGVYSTNNITMTVTSAVTPSVSIEPIETNVCQSTQVTFTANPINGGSAPGYQWKLNGTNVGLDQETYVNNSLQNGDIITVELRTSLTCATASNVVSGPVTMTIRPSSTFYADLDGDGYGNSGSGIKQTCSAPAGYVSNNNDCNDQNSSVNPGATEICGNGIDDDCDGQIDEGCSPDNDSDGYTVAQGDCNDNNSSIHPGATEVCGNGIDDDCDGQIDEGCSPDNDSDGYTVAQGDCNDNNPSIHPGATEVCGNGVDDDCDGQIDEGCSPDNDSDGYTVAQGDCNDNNSSIHPGATEVCGNGVDDDCDGQVDEGCSPDNDSDGYTVAQGDCNDNNSSIHPGAAEVCGNGVDDDCDGQIDEGCSPDNDSDGYTVAQGDCNDNNSSIYPGATEVCGNGVDDDCDGQVDEGCSPDNDSDGYTVAQGDCNDNNSSIHPGATEVCGNGIDDDCNGQVDENCTQDLPTLLVKTYPIKEGDAGYTLLDVEVKLDKPAVVPVSISYSTNNANATAGSDYVAANGVLTIPVGAVSGIVQIKIIGDLLRESNESFWISFTNPVNVIPGSNPNARIMIIDDDKGKPNSAATSNEALMEQLPFKIPTVVKRNQVWMIPQIGNYENEVLIMNVQGQVINRFINYKNQTPVANVATGLYFYRIRLMESSSQYKYYSGRLLITE